MSDDWLALGDGETVEWAGGPRLTTILPSVLFGLVVVAASAAGAVYLRSPLPLAVASVGLVPPIYRYLAVTNTRFVVTTDAVYRKTGVVGRSVTRAPLTKVQNSSYEQGLAGGLFGFGTVTVETAGGRDLRFYRIENPEAVRRLVDRVVGEQDEIPGSLEQWKAIREEVRRLRETIESR